MSTAAFVLLLAVSASVQTAEPPAPAAPAEAAPSTAAAAAPPGVYEVVRAGDGQRSCDELRAEINGMNAQVAAVQTAATRRMTEAARSASLGGGGGMGGPAAGVLAGLVPFGGTALGMAQHAQQEAQIRRMQEEMESASSQMTGLMPQYQRIEHLSEIYRQKSC